MDFYITQFFNLFLLNLMNLTSPGPETALMIHNSSYYSRKVGFYTGLGIVASTIIHKTYSFLGFGAFISKSPILFNSIKYAGGAYLVYLGIKMLFSPKKLVNANEDNEYITHLKRMTPKKAFRMGFMIDILCPSASLVFISIVAATVAPETPLSIQFIYGGLLVLSSFTWYTLQSLVFSQSIVKKVLDKSGVWLNRLMGAYMLYFAFKLMMRTLH
jgi:threonine/homoserine/homoserine lactone efflux protein